MKTEGQDKRRKIYRKEIDEKRSHPTLNRNIFCVHEGPVAID